MENQEKDKIRLSDRILSALYLALEQDDLKISETLTSALEMAMTRGTGGQNFQERRSYPPEMEKAMDKLQILREKSDAA